MNLNKQQRIKLYNAQLLIYNARRELDELVELLVNGSDECTIVIQYILRLQGINQIFKDFLKSAE